MKVITKTNGLKLMLTAGKWKSMIIDILQALLQRIYIFPIFAMISVLALKRKLPIVPGRGRRRGSN